MQLENVVELNSLMGCRELGKGYKMHCLGKMIDHGENGCITL